MTTRFSTRAALAGLALATIAAPALAQDRWDWHGGRAGERDYRLAGRGVPLLYPELRATNRGRAFVMRNFDFNHDGFVSPREAEAANRAFANAAGPRRDRFDWDHRDQVVVVDNAPGHWDRGAMHG
ncbi:MAG: OmpA family protein, partial [Pseudomonadota bacterium]|nr:OmpA family protein [Pseudomonadota bacterium]